LKPDTYVVLTENFGEEEYGVGVRKSDEAFLAELDKTLDAMKADGTVAQISEKWFGEDIIER
ncbi:MAG: transporter substrate-binding domain-containing protein, partial [Syntrophomonadaceae bacterium]|nr:transporter substrate-binding domain-containing protein [Syntrophomonadaceae bacterium]